MSTSQSEDANENQLRHRRQIISALALLLFPLLVVVAFFSSSTLKPSMVSFNFGSGTQTASLYAIQSQTAGRENNLFPKFMSFSLPSFPSINYGELLLAIASVIFILFLLNLEIRKPRRIPLTGNFAQEERLEVASILEAAAANLGSGGGYRETVLRCYKMISQVLQNKSGIDGKTLTAREFQREVSKMLKIDSPYLSKSTFLFEVARYSEEEITSLDAQDAADCLSNLAKELRTPAENIQSAK